MGAPKSILQIGTDRKVFDKESRTFKRIFGYGDIFEHLYILIPTTHKEDKGFRVGNVIVAPAYGSNKIFAYIKCLTSTLQVLDMYSTSQIYTQDAFEIGLLGLIGAKLKKRDLIVQVHTDILSSFFKAESARRLLQVLIAKYVLKRSGKIRVVSKRIKDSLVDKLDINPEKIFTIPIIPPELVVKPIVSIEDQAQFTFLIFSRLEKEKNIKQAINVFINLQKSVKNIKLKIVGDGSLYNEIAALTKDNQGIKLYKWQEDLDKVFTGVACMLLNSNFEGYAITPLEAAMYGIPTIMTDVGCASEFIINDQNGIVIKVGDGVGLYNAMQKISTQKLLTKNLGTNAQSTLKTLLEKSNTKKSLKEMFEAVMEKASKE